MYMYKCTNMSYNKLCSSCPVLPQGLEHLDASFNNITTLEGFKVLCRVLRVGYSWLDHSCGGSTGDAYIAGNDVRLRHLELK